MAFKKFLVATDNHGELACPVAVKKLMQFAADWKPDYRIHLGDNWDFAALRNGASQEEKSQGISADYYAGMEFLETFRPHFLTLGNHDDRIWLTSTKCGEGIVKELCQKLASDAEREFKRLKIKWCKYHVSRFLQLPEGGPKLIHGFRSTVAPARAHWQHWGDCIHGHVHAPDSHTARHVDQGQAYSVGCLADIDQLSYADRVPAKLGWRNGFLHGIINTKTGEWKAWHAVKEKGNWISPQGIL